jgi:uncharacterized protein
MFDLLFMHWYLLIPLILVLLILWGLAVLNKYVRLMLNIIRDTPPALLFAPLDFDHLEGHSISFRAYDGTILRGMFVTADLFQEKTSGTNRFEPIVPTPELPGKNRYLSIHNRGVIIFCHEFGSDRYSYSRYCKPLLEAGFDIFTFDFRSHGKSGSLPNYQPRLWCSDKEVLDVLGAIYLVESKVKETGREVGIGLFGISRGAGAAILAAHQTRQRNLVQAVLSDGLFSTDITLESMMKKWVHIFARVRFVYENHRPIFWTFLRWLLVRRARSRFRCQFPSVRKTLLRLKDTPTFLIHGEKDSYIKSEQAHTLYDMSSEPRFLWIVPEAKHNQSVTVDPLRYARRTVGFFEKYLALKAPAHTIEYTLGDQETSEFFGRDENQSLGSPARKVETNVGKKVAKTSDCGGGFLRSEKQPVPAEPIRKKTAPLP